MNMNYEEAQAKLKEFGQEHVLKYWEELSPREKSDLILQINRTDFSVCSAKPGQEERGSFAPLKAMQLAEIMLRSNEFLQLGKETIKRGKVGAVMLAGGMGTRLGWSGPKGTYNIGLNNDVFIFQRQIENLLENVKLTDSWIPLYIMTSEKNNNETVSFLKQHDYFGYNPDYVTFFMQDMAPACDREGKVYMESKAAIATSPNGNGGWFKSMETSNLIPDIHRRGIEWLNVFAVDNVLQRIADPYFIGAVLSSGKACGAKVVRKNAPDEKVGVICLEDGRPSIVEYYELTDEMRDAVDETGSPAYSFGVILNYLFNVGDLEKTMDKRLPLHVVEKKIPHIDDSGNPVKPESPNGYKFEQLVLDMIHTFDSCLPYEVVREREFAPVKNATGIDSVESAQSLCLKNGIML